MKRFALLAITISLLCGFTYGYRNNPQTGKPDIVTNGVTPADITGFANYSPARVICWKTSTTLGRCSSAVGATGKCTCN